MLCEGILEVYFSRSFSGVVNFNILLEFKRFFFSLEVVINYHLGTDNLQKEQHKSDALVG